LRFRAGGQALFGFGSGEDSNELTSIRENDESQQEHSLRALCGDGDGPRRRRARHRYGSGGALRDLEGGLSKVFRQLVRSGIAIGTRGIGGGYRLAKPPSKTTVQDVIRVLESEREEGRCLLVERYTEPCVDFPTCRLRRLFDEVDELVRCTFESISLETLPRGPSLRGVRRSTPCRRGLPVKSQLSARGNFARTMGWTRPRA